MVVVMLVCPIHYHYVFFIIDKECHLKCQECNFKVYNQGRLVYILYPLESGDSKWMEDVFKVIGDELKSSDSDEIKGLTPDYVETNVK